MLVTATCSSIGYDTRRWSRRKRTREGTTLREAVVALELLSAEGVRRRGGAGGHDAPVSRPPRLDEADVGSGSLSIPTWRLEEGHLIREIDTVDYPSSVTLVDSLVATAEQLDHHRSSRSAIDTFVSNYGRTTEAV